MYIEASADAAGFGHGDTGAATGSGLPAMPVGSAVPAGDSPYGAWVDWGDYRCAVTRWEHVTGRAAPHPVVRTGQGLRSSTVFVEWMMGLDHGFVTGRGLPRTTELRLLGTGVVPQQARIALLDLIARTP